MRFRMPARMIAWVNKSTAAEDGRRAFCCKADGLVFVERTPAKASIPNGNTRNDGSQNFSEKKRTGAMVMLVRTPVA
jgi:hypothetical protein